MTYYDEIAESYNKLHGDEQLRKAKLILKHLKVKKSDKLLDVGCGTGIATELFPCKLQGIDPAKELVKQCSFPAIVGKAEALPFKDNEFDLVISLTAVHNFDDIEKGLNEIKRVAKKRVILSILKKSSKLNEIESLIKKLFKVGETIDDIHDLIFFCHKV